MIELQSAISPTPFSFSFLIFRSCWRTFPIPAAMFFSAVTVAESGWLHLVERLFPKEEIQLAIDFPAPGDSSMLEGS